MDSTELTNQKGLSQRTKNILVIVAGMGALIIGALFIYAILVTPSRQPYRDALAQYENVNKANDTLNAAGASLNSSTATNDEFEKSIAVAQKAVKSVAAENKALGEKPVLMSGEGEKVYAVFNEKFQSYIQFNDSTLQSMLKVRPVLHECSGATSLEETAKSAEIAKKCVTNLQAIENVPNSDYAKLVENYKIQYAQIASILEQLSMLKQPSGSDSSAHDSLVKNLEVATNDLSATGTEFSKNFQQHRNAVSPVEISKQLHQYLTDKSRVF